MALVIGVVVGVTPDRWVRAWRERRPDAPLTVVPVAEGAAAAALADGTTMVFTRLPVEGVAPDAVHAIPLWEETPVVVAGRGHPVKLFDVVAEADLVDEQVVDGRDEASLDLVAAGHAIARMPQSVFRAIGRRDLVARPVADAPATRVGLVWLRASVQPEIDEFVGVVRGRTANSSRGAAAEPAPTPASSPAQPSRAKPVRAADPRRRRSSGRRRG